jgi:hypothetical protein
MKKIAADVAKVLGFDMKINELANNPNPYEVEYEDEDDKVINSSDLALSVYLTRGSLGKDDKVNIEFSVMGRYDITGAGKQFKIFSTVNAILKEHLPLFLKSSDRYVDFTADKTEPTRVKFYKSCAPYVSKILGNNWEYMEEDLPEHNLVRYLWTKINR